MPQNGLASMRGLLGVIRVIFAPYPRCLLVPRQRRNSRHPSTAAWGQQPTHAPQHLFRHVSANVTIILRPGMSAGYTTQALLVNQIVGVPVTPAFCIAFFSSALLAKACAASTVANS